MLDLFRNEDLHGHKVRLVGVSLSGFESAEQTSLFDNGSERKEKVQHVLDDIRGRFGKSALTRASLIDRPESNSQRDKGSEAQS